jgi:hypothetical protein
MKIPIACTLESSDARDQLGEWQEVLDEAVGGSERVSANRLELTIVPNADIGPVISLAQREIACCSFFSFTLEIQAERLVLAIEVPDDAVEVLDQLVNVTGTG